MNLGLKGWQGEGDVVGLGGNRFRSSVSFRDGKASVAEQAVMGETLEPAAEVVRVGGAGLCQPASPSCL